jgi:hypothetical protein
MKDETKIKPISIQDTLSDDGFEVIDQDDAD